MLLHEDREIETGNARTFMNKVLESCLYQCHM